VKVSKSLDDFVNQCFSCELGYFVEYDRVPPFFHERNLEFVTSLNKERNALGHNLQSYTNLLLREVTVLLNNGKDDYSDEMYLQMEYPKNNRDEIKLDNILQQLSLFQNLENITLAGEIEMSLLWNALLFLKEYNISVIHRVMFSAFNYELELELLAMFGNYSIELLVDNSVDTARINSLIRDRICVKAIINSIDDVEVLGGIKDVIYMPVLSNSLDNTVILTQMIMPEDDILNSSKSIKDCRISDYVNTSVFGHLTINYNGEVSVLGKRIASCFDSDLSSIINRWVGQNNCMWYKTRGKKSLCKECALQCLCPPISIYEELGLFKNACTI
jgi:pseudo-rSAM protein